MNGHAKQASHYYKIPQPFHLMLKN